LIYTVFVSDKWPGARYRHGCEGNTTVDPVETVCDDVDWIELDMARLKWVGFCDHVLNFIKCKDFIYKFIHIKYMPNFQQTAHWQYPFLGFRLYKICLW